MWAASKNISGYKHTYMCKGMKLSFDGIQGACQLDIPGTACSDLSYRQYRSEVDWKEFLNKINSKFKVTRVDYAFDVPESALNIDDLVEKHDRDEYVSHLRCHSFYRNGIKGKGCKGKTLFIGSVKGKKILVIYERKDTNQIRIEVRLRSPHAATFVEEFCQNGFGGILSSIGGIIRYCNPKKGDTNKSRWPTYEPWQRIIGHHKKLVTKVAPVEDTLYRRNSQFFQQYARTLANFLDDPRFGPKEMRKMYAQGREKRRPDDELALQELYADRKEDA